MYKKKYTEQENFEIMCKKKRKGFSAFVATPNKGIGESRSVVLIGNKQKGRKQGLKVWNENHRKRAFEYAKKYNEIDI